VVPALERLQRLPDALGQANVLLADTGYFSEANVNGCETDSITPYIPAELKLISSNFQHNNKRKALCLPDFPFCHWLKHLP